jgi:hypothetical protein
VGEMLRRMRRLVPRWKRIDDRNYYDGLLDTLRFMATSLHNPWRAQNPWALGLNHGQIYASQESRLDNRRLFRVFLEFERDDFDRWKRAAKEIPKDRFIDAFDLPVRWRWMIEEMEWTERDGITGLVIPCSRRPLDRETLQKLVRTGRVVVLDGDDSMD